MNPFGLTDASAAADSLIGVARHALDKANGRNPGPSRTLTRFANIGLSSTQDDKTAGTNAGKDMLPGIHEIQEFGCDAAFGFGFRLWSAGSAGCPSP